jgi:carbon-monoxide dehydrogenase large subunit
MCGLAPSNILGALRYVAGGWDAAEIECRPDGKIVVRTGTSPHGQGHETTWSQVVADGLGVTPDDVEVLHGDTSVSRLGMDTYGSRSAAVGAEAVARAIDKVKEKARTIAAHELEVAEDDLTFENGTFTVAGTDRSTGIKEIAFAAWHAHNLPDGLEPGLDATAVFDPENFSWPAGCHVAVVEVDTETGSVDLVRYIAVDDVGNLINPQIVNGQIHGGIAQGVAQALFEEAVYDDQGTLVTGSMASYMVPAASELPSFDIGHAATPSPNHPTGSKGVGETGTIASTPAVINAVVDALAHLGVTDVEMPATPERVWNAINDASADGSGLEARAGSGFGPGADPGSGMEGGAE